MTHGTAHRYEPPTQMLDLPDQERPRSERLVFDRRAVREVDRVSIEEFGIPGLLLMENAARGLADEVMRMLEAARAAGTTGAAAAAEGACGLGESPCVLIMCGGGNNGGDGYALARQLHNREVEVALCCIEPPRAGTDAATNRAICRRMELREIGLEDVREFIASSRVSLIVDALVGTGLDRPVAAEAALAEAIEIINTAKRPVLAVDIPSGMDCDSGQALGRCVRATRTVTFVGVKKGFIDLDAQKLLGEVVVVDIGAPRGVRERLGRPTVSHREPPEHAAPETEQIKPPGR